MRHLILIVAIFFAIGCKQNSSQISGDVLPIAPPEETPHIWINSTDVFSSVERLDFESYRTVDYTERYWVTETLTLNQSVFIAYELNSISLSEIKFKLDPPAGTSNFPDYAYGDLEVYASSNSTDGLNGTWFLIGQSTYATRNQYMPNGIMTVSASNVTWLRLEMTYTGTGAYGSTPAFYLTDIWFKN